MIAVLTDIWVIGLIAHLAILPLLAIRYDILSVRTTLKAEFTSKKVNEFIIINSLFSIVWPVTDFLGLFHFAHRVYFLWRLGIHDVTDQKLEKTAPIDPTDISIVGKYDLNPSNQISIKRQR